jgi:hypothetical protein
VRATARACPRERGHPVIVLFHNDKQRMRALPESRSPQQRSSWGGGRDPSGCRRTAERQARLRAPARAPAGRFLTAGHGGGTPRPCPRIGLFRPGPVGPDPLLSSPRRKPRRSGRLAGQRWLCARPHHRLPPRWIPWGATGRQTLGRCTRAPNSDDKGVMSRPSARDPLPPLAAQDDDFQF